MSKTLTDSAEIKRTLDLFHDGLDEGKRLNELPLRTIDWNSIDGMTFLKERCRRGNGENIVKNITMFRLGENNVKNILGVAVQKGVPMESLPLRSTFTGGKNKCKTLWDIIVDEGKGRAREFLDALRSDKATHCEAKKDAYDYVVAELKRKKIATFPDSRVVFGVLHEEEEVRRSADEDRRKRVITKERMSYLTMSLGAQGIGAMKEIWSAVTGLGELNYINSDDVSEHPLFIEKLTNVVNSAVEKGFEETFRCVRALPLLYGGAELGFDSSIPDVVDKAFKKYSMLLKAIEKIYLDEEMAPREKHDYFFWARLAATNPNFDLMDINLARLPDEGVTLYTDQGEAVVLPLQQQLEAIVETAIQAGVAEEDLPKAFAGYHVSPEGGGILNVLYKWKEGKKAAEQKDAAPPEPKKSWMGRLLDRINKN